MIRLARCTQASKAGTYFRLHLASGDNSARPAIPSVYLRSAWTGPALSKVNLAYDTQPEAKHLVRLGRGLHPTKNVRLAPSVNRKRAYYDLTASPPKTITLAAPLDPGHPTARNVIHAHHQAMEAVCKAVGPLVLPRSGTGPGDWLGALFTHTHSREGDPHLHGHLILPNVALNREGRWRAMQINIAGPNRTHLELVYGHTLARTLRRLGLGEEIIMRSNGLPRRSPVRKSACAVRPFSPSCPGGTFRPRRKALSSTKGGPLASG